MYLPSATTLAGVALAASSVYYLLGHYFFKPRDWRFAANGVRIVRLVKGMARRRHCTPELWYESLAKRPLDKPAMVFEGRTYTFGDLEEASNRFANWALSRGLGPGDVVALYMQNCPEYVACWLGLAKVGATTALINHSLKMEPLVHSIGVSNASCIVFGAGLAGSVAAVRDELGDADLFVFSRTADEREAAARDARFAEPLDDALVGHSASPPPRESTSYERGARLGDTFLYVYTSGTTGMPKAARITHFRFAAMAHAMPLFFGVRTDDRVYCTLPLFHSAGGLLGVGVMFSTGCTLVLRRKFSASKFWSDVREHNCTVVQYIGELLRFLVAQPARPDDADNPVRLAIGNGLRAEVWGPFVERFNVPQIAEFYGASEGGGVLTNTEGKVGAVGFISPLLRLVADSRLVKYDAEAEDVVRDASGFCIPCAAGEEGEYVVKVKDFAKGVSNYSGYTDKAASNKKLLRDVFSKGDVYFRSGDLLRMDDEGFVYFVDRLGDTFRWRGENVSTSEVSHVVATFSAATAEPNVYGVRVPGHDGRAGAVAFEAAAFRPDSFDWAGFRDHVSSRLASYARPLFVRVLSGEMEKTATHKHKKGPLREQGVDPAACGGDRLFFFNGDEYVPLTQALYDGISSGRVRV